jgi:hypothetical protein
MHSCVAHALSNLRGGIIGVLIYLVISGVLFFVAFMAAFGNDTPTARLILQTVEIYFLVANPLWAVPLSYFAGGCLITSGEENYAPGE